MKRVIAFLSVLVLVLSMTGMAAAIDVDATDAWDSSYQATQFADQTIIPADLSTVASVTITYTVTRSNWGWENGALIVNCPKGWVQFSFDGGSEQKDFSAVKGEDGVYTLTIPLTASVSVTQDNVTSDVTMKEALESTHDAWGQFMIAYYYIDDNNSAADKLTVSSITFDCAHNNTEKDSSTAVAATCISYGRTADLVCSDCGQIVEEGEEITLLAAHTEETIPVVEPTCTKPGSSSGSKCSVCGVMIAEPDTVLALGHAYDETTHRCTRCDALDPACCEHEASSLDEETVKEATCTEAGYSGDVVCDECGEIQEEGEVIPALGHTEETIAAVAATCTKAGSTEGKKCSVCDKVLVEVKEVAATGHSFGDYVVTKEATVDAAGEKTATCSVCGEKDVKSIDKLPAPETEGTAEESKEPTSSETESKGDKLIASQKPTGGADITVFDGVDLSDKDIYIVLTIETTESGKEGWGAGAIASKQEGWPAVYEIQGGAEVGTRTVTLTGPELLEILKGKTRDKDQYGPAYEAGTINFESGAVYNSWGSYATLTKIEVYKKGAKDANANTADSMNVAILAVLAVIACAGVAFAAKKRA